MRGTQVNTRRTERRFKLAVGSIAATLGVAVMNSSASRKSSRFLLKSLGDIS
ncbi:hypothetical protein [Exiguobacterium sp. SH5S13]|uniref:hypothetical protein n=1 Tax=Exiguobacterium sp. SH5S13 TaxID=2510959 RepID=UPI001375A770|nr:hypothetical protein [Exiguobacterium sp. SH5S13]